MDIIDEIRENSSAIMNTYIMVIGVVTGFLSMSVKKKTQICGTITLASIYVILTETIYQNATLTKLTLFLAIAWVIVCVLLVWKREIVSRAKLDKMIRKFTEKADYAATLCVFGGDLDFFGDVPRAGRNSDRRRHNKNCITENKQFLQLKKMKFRDIKILCLRPVDVDTRLRIGFLKHTLGDALTIKFVQEKECGSCPDRFTCLACDLCNDCPENRMCRRRNINLCEKLRRAVQHKCYNPDTKLRGRIASLKGTGSVSAAIVTTQTSGKSYYLKEYNSDTKECTIYQNIWNVWWKKCQEDKSLIEQCVNEYKAIQSSNGGGNR